MEASKCPKCGEEPQFIEHIEKWYCYGCNTYVEDDAEHVCASEETKDKCAAEIKKELQTLEEEESKLECKNCGAELEDLKEGRLYCFVCETYQDESHEVNAEAKPEPGPEPKVAGPPPVVNEAQNLLETASPPVKEEVPEAVAPGPQPTPVADFEAHRSEPIIDRVDEPVAKPVAETKRDAVPVALPELRTCPSCGQPIKWIEKYQRHYCYSCRKYAPSEIKKDSIAHTGNSCPGCGGELKFIEKYSEWYCYKCKKYPLRVVKRSEAPKPQSLVCPKCKGPVKWIDKYARYYCESCKEYAPKGFGGIPSDAGDKKQCPTCHEAMKFVPEYNEWYCYKCKKYSLRPSKPVLLF
ncbi:MAG: hypothetical protein A3K76_07220 [Euryarchaeota archaeon RBG_13_57_23]|nr:MAG: hypothetical protein A3K76_07220 [Euryarchaeota archaeon RBG_13_57_23]